MSQKPKILIVTAVWGDWHVSMFLDLNLRTLLAAGNFPALAEYCDITYLIYTSAADMQRLRGAQAIQALGKFMVLEFRTIAAVNLEVPIAAHHALWGQAMSKAKEERSLILLMPPDVAWSNGSFNHIGRTLASGKKTIYMTFLRVESDSCVEAIRENDKPGDEAISVSGRQLVELGLRTLHPIQAAYLRDSTYFPYHPEMMFWAIPEEGLLCRVLVREMFIFDPAAVQLNKVNLLASDLDIADIHVVDDSDDLFAVSLTPFGKDADWYRWPSVPDPAYIGQWWTEYDSWVNDLIAGTKLRWHCRAVTEQLWRERERGADLFLRRAASIREGRRLFDVACRLSCTVTASLLSVAAQTTVMSHVVRGLGGALVFMPTDRAFANCPSHFLEHLLQTAGERDLARLMRAHFVPGEEARLPSSLEARLQSSSAADLVAADGTILRCSRLHGPMEVNGARILGESNISGKLHVYLIDSLLAPIDRAYEPRADLLPALREHTFS